MRYRPAVASPSVGQAGHLFGDSFHLGKAQLAHQMLASNPRHCIGYGATPFAKLVNITTDKGTGCCGFGTWKSMVYIDLPYERYLNLVIFQMAIW